MTDKERALYDAILHLKTVQECSMFFRDLCTPTEITAMTDRFRVARLLDQGKLSYRDIQEQTKVSLATITRVARFLTQEVYQGYRLIFDRLKHKGLKS